MGRMNLLGLVAASFVACSVNAMEVDTRVIQALRSNASNITVVVHLEGRADMQPFLKGHAPAQASNVIAALEQHHAAAAAPLINAMKARAPQGVKEITHLWAINSLRIKGTPDAIRTLLQNRIQALLFFVHLLVQTGITHRNGRLLRKTTQQIRHIRPKPNIPRVEHIDQPNRFLSIDHGDAGNGR